MAIPGAYDITLVENSTNQLSFTISDITTTSGYNVQIDIREDETPDSDLILGLTPGSGLSLVASAEGLTIGFLVTETQIDDIADELVDVDAWWSLKVTAPDTSTRQYLKGNVRVVRTPTE